MSNVTNNSIIISFPDSNGGSALAAANAVQFGLVVFDLEAPDASSIRSYAGATWNGSLFKIDTGNGNSMQWDAASGAMDILSKEGIGFNVNMTAESTNNAISAATSGTGVAGAFGTDNVNADAAIQGYAPNGFVWLCNPLRDTLLHVFSSSFDELFKILSDGRVMVRVGTGNEFQQPILTYSAQVLSDADAPKNVAATDPTWLHQRAINAGLLSNVGAEYRIEYFVRCENNANNKRIYFKVNGQTVYDTGTMPTIGGSIAITMSITQCDEDVNTLAIKIVGVSNDTAHMPNIASFSTFDVSGITGGAAGQIPDVGIQFEADADDDMILNYIRESYIPATS